MKHYVKYVAWIIVAITILILGWRITRLLEGEPQTEYTVTAPIDSGFVPIIKKEFKPRSTPFERPSKPPVRLPRGVKEKDVERALIIIKKPVNELVPADTTRIIELKSGEFIVQDTDSVEMTVEEITYTDPILSFALFASAGISAGRTQSKFSVSPVVATSPLQILGMVQAPIFLADLNGAGIGVGYRWGNILLGAGSYWSYEGLERNLKFSIHYAIN